MKPWRKLLDRPVSKCMFLACMFVVVTGGRDCYYEDKEPDPGTIKYYASASPQSVDLSPASSSVPIILSGDCNPKPSKGCPDPSGWMIGHKTLGGSYSDIVIPAGGNFVTARITAFDWDAIADLASSVDGGVVTKEVSFEPTSAPYPVTGNRTVTVRLHPPQPGGERTEEPAGKPRLTAIPPPSPMTGERTYQAALAYTGPDTRLDVAAGGDTIYIHTRVGDRGGAPVNDYPLVDGALVPLEIEVSGGVSGKTYKVTLTFTTKTSPAVSTAMVLTAEYR